MESLPYRSSTSGFSRYDSTTVAKLPMKVWRGNPNYQKLEEEMEQAIDFERRVLERLGDHSRIVPYLGPHDKGILLIEASHGNLQSYIDSNQAIDNSLRWKWSVQAVEAVAFVHSKGVIHSDLRPENYLVHETKEMSLDIWLCDFGGSRCDELGSNVVHLPDDPFFDPRLPWDSTPATDIFSLGSIIYNIVTGHWPYRQSPMVEEDKEAHSTQVNQLFTEGAFPNVSALRGGEVIEGCWNHRYKTAEEVFCAIKLEMATLDKQDSQVEE